MSKPTRIEHPHANTEQAENKRGKYRLYNSFSFGNFNIAFFLSLICCSIWQIKLTESGEWLGSAYKKNTLLVPRMQRKSYHMKTNLQVKTSPSNIRQ